MSAPRLGIRFEPCEGPNNLRIFGPDGQPFLTHQQMADRAEAERQRAEAERPQRTSRRGRTPAPRADADRLAARLRELGVDPE